MSVSVNYAASRLGHSRQTTGNSELFWFMSASEWVVAIGVGALVSLLCLPLYDKVSLWIGPVLLLTVVAVFHCACAARCCIPIGNLGVIVACIQLVLGAWWSYYYPIPSDMDIGERIGTYLSYAGPVVIAFSVGWFAACGGLPRPVRRSVWVGTLAKPAKLQRELDLFIFGGLGVMILHRVIFFGSLDFVAVLLSNLRYVGIWGWMILGVKGWRWRAILVAVSEVFLSLESTMFHSVVLWLGASFCVYAYCFQLRPQKTLAIICAVLALLVPLEYGKYYFRSAMWYGAEVRSELLGSNRSIGSVSKPVAFAALLGDFVVNSFAGRIDEQFFQHVSERYNQGWIINQVMLRVPAIEPYAEGETIVGVFTDALLPRFLVAKSYMAGGRELMRRFAGIELGGVSMNLGYAGEMYANFGLHGGVVGVGVYGLMFGLLFRWMYRRAINRPLWWAFAPYVLILVVKAEEGIADAVNWIVKAMIVSIIVVYACPALRAALSTGRARQMERLRWTNSSVSADTVR